MTMMTPQPLDQQEDEEMLVPHSDLVEGPQPLVEGPQPMEVASVDNAGTVENQASDEPQASRFTWTIENFSRLNMKKLYSDVFVVGVINVKLRFYCGLQLGHPAPVQSKESDWGFTSFMPLSELYDPNKGYLVNDTCVVEADVAVRKVIDYWTYDSKKETGYVGLKNQGATCYMNSLLQTLYHIPYFRKVPIYSCELSCSDINLFDLQLDVKGCKDVYASFDKYVEVERLEGDNKYHAEEHGLQDAKKGVLFIDFPPVLQLQLKRFEYDFMRDTMVKINDRYEFPLELDLDRDNGKYLSPEADRSVRNLYMLHRYKFDDERVTKEDVKRALEEQYGGEEELPQTNPGYNNTPFKFTKYSNAYMLVYIRVSDKDKIICDVDEKDIAEHLRLKKEQEEKEDKRRYKAQAHLYTISRLSLSVARDEDLREQIGKDIYFDLVDHDKVRNFRIQKQMPFNLFKNTCTLAPLLSTCALA
ncbi:Ubiquitin carboxyl-terminal hydrolase 12, partial [Sesamum angolense]